MALNENSCQHGGDLLLMEHLIPYRDVFSNTVGGGDEEDSYKAVHNGTANLPTVNTTSLQHGSIGF